MGKKMGSLRKIEMPSIAFVVARSHPGHVIGCENKLPWRLKGDLRRFKETTTGHVVIMGRKTFHSIGRPLPNRKNIVITRNFDLDKDGVVCAQNAESALFLADYYSIIMEKMDLFVIGGDAVYKLFEGLFNKVYLTEIFGGQIVGDAFFNYEFDRRRWKTISEQDFPKSEDDQFPCRLTVLERRTKYVRQRELSDFFTVDPAIEQWLGRHKVEADSNNSAPKKDDLENAIMHDQRLFG